MAELKRLAAGDRGTLDIERGGEPTRRWASSHGAYIAGRAWIDEADHTAAQRLI